MNKTEIVKIIATQAGTEYRLWNLAIDRDLNEDNREEILEKRLKHYQRYSVLAQILFDITELDVDMFKDFHK